MGVHESLKVFERLPGVVASYVWTKADDQEAQQAAFGFSEEWKARRPLENLSHHFSDEGYVVVKTQDHSFLIERRTFNGEADALIIVQISQGDRVIKSIRRSIRRAFGHLDPAKESRRVKDHATNPST